MKVLGFNDEITTCDCCGKRNLSGTFAVETDAGDVLRYGSVCVVKTYGKKRAAEITRVGKAIAKVQSSSWHRAVDLVSRGMVQPLHGFIGEKPAWNNSSELMARVDSIRDCRTGAIVKQRAAA